MYKNLDYRTCIKYPLELDTCFSRNDILEATNSLFFKFETDLDYPLLPL